MAMKNQGRKTYTTARGKTIDLDLLMKRNELTPAVGNARVNARGDELGAGGKIIRKREEVVQEYYKGNTPVIDENNQRLQQAQSKKETPSLSDNEQALVEEFDNGWEEDEDGNFVKKQ
jgi:hypothetical protein